MRSNRVRLGMLAVVALVVPPCSALAQTISSYDAAIAELRQLMADQRAAIDRQARIIEEQGRQLAALQQQVGGTNRNTQPRKSGTAAAEPHRICRRWSFRQESSRVRSAFPGPSRPSKSVVRREWSRFTH